MRIRSRKAGDLPGCVDVLREVHDSDGYPDRWPAHPVDWLTPPDSAAAWVAEYEGELVGHLVLVDRGDSLWVSRLFARPSSRGLGTGAALLAHARGFAGARTLMLDVIEQSTAAVALYERLGWTLVDRRPAEWTMRDGTTPIERIYALDPTAF